MINGDNDKVEEIIFVGSTPYDLDVDAFTNKVYVSNVGSNTISVIDGATNKVVANIVNITTPVGLDVDSADSYVYVTSIDTNTVSKIDAVTNKVVDTVTVGKAPYSIDIKQPVGEHDREYKIYVSNLGSNSVSVIDGSSFTLIENITVGKLPAGLAVNDPTNTVYVANRRSDTVSVIDSVSDTVVKNLTIGKEPDGIDINFRTNMIYVTNTGSNTISVIDGKKNDVIKELIINQNISPELLDLLQIQEEDLPPTLQFPNVASFVDVNQATNMVYVTNTGSSTVSVINGTTNSLLVGKTLSINPSNSGQLECVDRQNNNNKIMISTNQYFRIAYGGQFECIAHPYPSNAFSFWSHTLDSKNKIQLYGNEYENLTANFREIPPPIPQEYWNTLYGVIVSSIIGWSIPSIVRWIKVRSHQKRLRYYHNRIQCLYDDGKLDQNDIESLDVLQIDIVDAYAKGKITEPHYTNLKNEISLLYEEIYRKKIDSLNRSISDENNSKFLDRLKSDITDACAKGKLNEVHYNLLNEKISKMVTDNNLKGKVYIESIKSSPV